MEADEEIVYPVEKGAEELVPRRGVRPKILPALQGQPERMINSEKIRVYRNSRLIHDVPASGV
jgi:hypothetical protein